MASRYTHDETFALRAEGMRAPRVASGSSGLKWKTLAAVTGVTLSIGAVGTAFLKLGSSSARDAEWVMELEAHHVQLRGIGVTRAADAPPKFSYEFIRSTDPFATVFTSSDASQALQKYFMEQEGILASDSSLSRDQLNTKQQTMRGVWFVIDSCIRRVFDQWVTGQDEGAIAADQFPVFKDRVLSTCPDAVAAFEASDAIVQPTTVLLRTPSVVGAAGWVILDKPSPTIVEPPRPWEVLSDPQPGPPAGEEDEVDPDSRQELKSMLMKQFGLTEPEGGDPGTDTTLDTALVPEETAAVTAGDVTEAKAELRQALLNIISPKQQKATESPIIAAIADHTQGWNWLHPVVQSYPLLKDSNRDTVSVPAVSQYLQTEGSTRAQKLISELLRTQSEYQRTLNCFMQGANNRGELSRDEYDKVVQWMNDACASEGQVEQLEVQEAKEENPGHSFMTKEQFKALIAKHFEPVLGAFNTSQLAIQHDELTAKRVLDKVQSCIDLATDNAVDTATGDVSNNKLTESLDWILQTCVDK